MKQNESTTKFPALLHLETNNGCMNINTYAVLVRIGDSPVCGDVIFHTRAVDTQFRKVSPYAVNVWCRYAAPVAKRLTWDRTLYIYWTSCGLKLSGSY